MFSTTTQTNHEECVMRLAAYMLIILAFIITAAGCTGAARDLTIVTKAVRTIANESTAGAPELGVSVPPSGNVYWVEGQVKNGGTEEVRQVTITFRVTDGNTNYMLRAEVAAIAPGKTVSYRTVTQASRTGLRLIDEAPDISVK
jgi:hypothetical protein